MKPGDQCPKNPWSGVNSLRAHTNFLPLGCLSSPGPPKVFKRALVTDTRGLSATGRGMGSLGQGRGHSPSQGVDRDGPGFTEVTAEESASAASINCGH